MKRLEDEIDGGENDLTERNEGGNEQEVSFEHYVSKSLSRRPILRGENEHVQAPFDHYWSELIRRVGGSWRGENMLFVTF